MLGFHFGMRVGWTQIRGCATVQFQKFLLWWGIVPSNLLENQDILQGTTLGLCGAWPFVIGYIFMDWKMAVDPGWVVASCKINWFGYASPGFSISGHAPRWHWIAMVGNAVRRSVEMDSTPDTAPLERAPNKLQTIYRSIRWSQRSFMGVAAHGWRPGFLRRETSPRTPSSKYISKPEAV